MVILSAQRMQRLSEKLQQVERSVERGGSELEELRDVDEELASAGARVGVELQSLRQLDAGTLARALSRGPGGGGGRVWAAAELLFVDGLATRRRGEERVARARWEKAAFLYRRLGDDLELPDEATPPAERLERIGS